MKIGPRKSAGVSVNCRDCGGFKGRGVLRKNSRWVGCQMVLRFRRIQVVMQRLLCTIVVLSGSTSSASSPLV